MAVSAVDEFMCHQTVSTFDHVDTSDLQWTERVWFSAFEKTGRLQINFGMGKYINRNVLDGSLGVTVGGVKQHNVRASRALFPEIDTYAAGPIAYRIIEPLKRIGLSVTENVYGLSCDIEFIANTGIMEQKPQMFRRRNGRLVNHMVRYFQCGAVQGWIKIDGEIHEIRQQDWWAGRDRSWGIRSNTGEFNSETGEHRNLIGGLQPSISGEPYRWNFFIVQFEGWSAAYEFAETPDGKRKGPALGHLHFAPGDRRAPLKIIDVKHQWEFHPGSHRIRRIVDVIHTEDGGVREVTMEPISLCYRRPGGGNYGGYKGWSAGLWMGDLWVDGDMLDITDEALVAKLHFADDHALRCTCEDEVGYGVCEPLIPGISELLTT